MRSRNEEPIEVWVVVETSDTGSQVVAVNSDEGAARISANVRRKRGGVGARHVHVTGPHLVARSFA